MPRKSPIPPLGEFVRRQRKARSLSVTELAAHAKLPVSDVESCERDDVPNVQILRALARALCTADAEQRSLYVSLLIQAGILTSADVTAFVTRPGVGA